MKKILIIVPILFLLFTSCNKDLSTLNIDKKQAVSVPSYTLFSNGQRNLVDYMTSANVNRNIFRLITQQWTEITYVDESNFDLGTRTIPDNWWRAMYKLVLVNLEASRKLIPTDVEDPDQQKNELAMLDIMEVYTYYVLVNTFGDVPYQEALDPANLFPKYDDAKTIYYDLLDRLDADIAALNASAPGFGDADLLYAGDVEKWIKFANSFKLRMGITISDFDSPKAKTIIETAAPNAFTSNADNAVFKYLPTTPNTNPVWVDLVQSGRNDFVGTSTIVNKMLALNDPRISSFFGLVQDSGKFIGAIPGKTGTFKLWSPPSDVIELPDAPSTIMSYAEVEFILAEAVERGYNVPGTAASHYNSAVTASILDWGGTTTDATAYLAQPSVAYATAPGTYKEKIGIQKYLALYNQGFDAWTEQRRLDYPVLPAPFQPQSAYPVRFTYPANEQNLNSSSWTAAKTAMGGKDEVDFKLFWDLN
jgi:hypothetical protein